MAQSKVTEGVTPPQSFHSKSLPTGDSSPGPMSFNKKKDGSNGGDLRPFGYKPTDKWSKVS